MAVRVQREDFDLGAELAGAAGRAHRHRRAGQLHRAGARRAAALAALELEHYPGMTEKALAAIEAEARGALAARRPA